MTLHPSSPCTKIERATSAKCVKAIDLRHINAVYNIGLSTPMFILYKEAKKTSRPDESRARTFFLNPKHFRSEIVYTVAGSVNNLRHPDLSGPVYKDRQPQGCEDNEDCHSHSAPC